MKARFRERSDIIGLLAVVYVILCIVIPQLLLSSNIEYIPKAVMFYRYFFSGAFAAFFIFSFIVLFLPRRIALVIVSMLCAYAIIIFIFDILYPLRIGPIVRGTESGKFSLSAGLVQLGLIGILFFIVYYIPQKVRGSLSWTLAGLLLVLNISFLFGPSTSETDSRTASAPVYENEKTPDFNIYHLVLDSYYGPWLQWALAELKEDTCELAGFTHYRRNVSNYWLTVLSYPSFMSGTMYSSENNYEEWRRSTNQDSLVEDLHARRFLTSFYGFETKNGVKHIQNKFTEDPGETGVARLTLVMDYWILRISPVFFRHKVLIKGSGPVTNLAQHICGQPSGVITTLVSYRQFEKFLSDEKQRSPVGNYVHVYCFPPHPPYQLDRNGVYIGTSSYLEQTLLATNMILKFVQTLKDQGKFDNSLIIVQADHGNVTHDVIAPYKHTARYAGDPLRDFIKMPIASSKKMLDTYFKYNNITVTEEELETKEQYFLPAAARFFGFGIQSGASLEVRFQPLLLIKPRATGPEAEDLVVNDALVQLLDLREYVRKSVDEGSGVYPEREAVSIHIPLYLKLETFTSQFGQYIIHSDGVWELSSVFEVDAEYM